MDPVDLVPLRNVAFNDRQDVMEGETGRHPVPQAHDVTQHQPSGVLPLLAPNVEGLQLQ